MKDMTILKRALEKKRQLVVRNADEIVLAEIRKKLSPIDLDGKYIWVISNIDIDTARDLRLIDITKYWRLASQIEKKVNRLYKD